MVKKLLIFDFDNTLTNLSLIDQFKLISIDNVSNCLSYSSFSGDLYKKCVPYSFFNNYNHLYNLFFKLKKQGYGLSIASFNNSTYISNFINLAFPDIFDYIIGIDNIESFAQKYLKYKKIKITNFKVIDKNCNKGYGKNLFIKILSKIYNISYSQIYFFDDDLNNVQCAKEILKIKAYNNKKSGVTTEIIENFIKF
jgi:hypothetical protein